MPCIHYIDDRGLPVHLCLGGNLQTIVVNGKSYFFEMHEYCGPFVASKKDWSILKNQPGARSPFWPAVTAWDKQGRRVDENGVCIWEPVVEPELRTVHLAGNHYLVIGADDDPEEERCKIFERAGVDCVPDEEAN